MTTMTERDFALDVVRRLQAAGHVGLWAGGCVRDELLGLAPVDYDIATSATPEQVQSLFRRTHSFGASFGVVEVLGARAAGGEWLKVEVATFRTDGTYTDGRRPDAVVFSTPEEDAKRRDFTMNGLFFDPVAEVLHDFVGGRADIAAKIVRAVGNPAERFAEDKLRILRAVRMAARFRFTLDDATAAAVRAMASQVTVVSAERIGEELRKILTHPNRAAGYTLLASLGLRTVLLPEVADGTGAIERLERLPERVAFPTALASVLIDVPAAAAAKICRRFKLSNAETDDTTWLVEQAAIVFELASRPHSRSYPILADDRIRELVLVGRSLRADASLDELETRLDSHPREHFNPAPLLTGDQLRAEGFTPGPRFKSILAAVRAAQLDGEATTPEQARAIARQLWERGP